MNFRPSRGNILGMMVVHPRQFFIWGEAVILTITERASPETLFEERCATGQSSFK